MAHQLTQREYETMLDKFDQFGARGAWFSYGEMSNAFYTMAVEKGYMYKVQHVGWEGSDGDDFRMTDKGIEWAYTNKMVSDDGERTDNLLQQRAQEKHFDSGMMYDQPQPAPEPPAKRTPLYTTVEEAARVLSDIAGEPISVFDPFNDHYWVATCRRASRDTLKNRAAYLEWERSFFAMQDRINAAGIRSGYESVYVSAEDERWANIRFNVSHPKVWGVK